MYPQKIIFRQITYGPIFYTIFALIYFFLHESYFY